MKWVVNRAGIKEELDIKKIREKLIKACDNLEVNMVELESHIDAIYQEGITTKKIQETLLTRKTGRPSRSIKRTLYPF